MSINIGYYPLTCYIYEIEPDDTIISQSSNPEIVNPMTATYKTKFFTVKAIHTITGEALPFPPKLKINAKYKYTEGWTLFRYYRTFDVACDILLTAATRSIYSPYYSDLIELNYRTLQLFKNPYTNTFKLYHENGEKSVEFFIINNCKQGKYIEYYENGAKKREMDFVNGKKHGVFKYYDISNRLTGITTYENDIIHGEHILFDNKCIKVKCYYSNGKLHGEYIEYYSDGNIKIKCQYSNGELHGDYIEDVYNNVINIIPYVNGKIDGMKLKLWPNGKKRYTIEYKNGKRNGLHIEYDQNENPKIILEFNDNKQITYDI
jgi:antitoxin component YwqK of YwqJK toxin-antitoxin module